MECGCTFPKGGTNLKAHRTNLTGNEGIDWEDEEEEMDGGIGEDLFGESW